MIVNWCQCQVSLKCSISGHRNYDEIDYSLYYVTGREWANKPMTGCYAIADRIPPSLAGSHAFHMLDRNILGLVTQARTGHRHFGEYYTTHNIQEPSSCPCGAETQTCDHILFKCKIHKEHGYLIDEGAPDHKLTTILRTKK